MANTTTKQDERETADAISLLVSQHREVEALLDRLDAESPRSPAFQRAFEELADALAIHTTIEEQIFYPAAKNEETEELLENSVEEHLAVKRVLATMLDAEPNGDILAELDELGGLTEEHVLDEERELFPLVRKAMDEAELQDLGARMQELVDKLRREGAPRTHVGAETGEAAPI
jgi:hemerythrin superfamily protein